MRTGAAHSAACQNAAIASPTGISKAVARRTHARIRYGPRLVGRQDHVDAVVGVPGAAFGTSV
jgi:hypothetical protein